jgi:hypothetical protein
MNLKKKNKSANEALEIKGSEKLYNLSKIIEENKIRKII